MQYGGITLIKLSEKRRREMMISHPAALELKCLPTYYNYFFRLSSLDIALCNLWQVGKIIKVALSAALKQTAARDLEPRSMLYLRRTFPRKKIKVARHFNYDVTTQYNYAI